MEVDRSRLFWIRSFRSQREAEDMKKILIKFGLGKEFEVRRMSHTNLFDLNCLTYRGLGIANIQGFVRGWIACTNTRSERPRIK